MRNLKIVELKLYSNFMIRFKKEVPLENYLNLIKADLIALVECLEAGEECLSKSDSDEYISLMADFETELANLISLVDLYSVKIRKAKILRNRIKRIQVRIQQNTIKYSKLKSLYGAAEKSVSLSGKQTLQWKRINTEYDLAKKAIRFKAWAHYERVLGDLEEHIDDLNQQIKQEQALHERRRQKILNQIDEIAQDPLYEYICDDSERKAMEVLKNDLNYQSPQDNTGGPNLNYIANNLDEITKLLFRRNNQLNILVNFDKYIRERSRSGKNTYYTLPDIDKISEYDDFDSFFRRSIRAVNR